MRAVDLPHDADGARDGRADRKLQRRGLLAFEACQSRPSMN
jgi:hypothetical protein